MHTWQKLSFQILVLRSKSEAQFIVESHCHLIRYRGFGLEAGPNLLLTNWEQDSTINYLTNRTFNIMKGSVSTQIGLWWYPMQPLAVDPCTHIEKSRTGPAHCAKLKVLRYDWTNSVMGEGFSNMFTAKSDVLRTWNTTTFGFMSQMTYLITILNEISTHHTQ